LSRALVALALTGLAACAGVDPREAAIERGELALSLDEPEDATDAFHSALLYRPGDAEALHGLARAHTARGDGETALEVFELLGREHPSYLEQVAAADRYRALLLAARVRLERDDPAGALRLLRRAEEHDPKDAVRMELLRRSLIAQSGKLLVAGRRDEAEAALGEALGGAPARGVEAQTLARALLEVGRIDSAISVLSDALLRDPADPTLRRLMDRALQIRYPELPWMDTGESPAAAEVVR
jgi:tetratricopeptide (TPR) repeat protein